MQLAKIVPSHYSQQTMKMLRLFLILLKMIHQINSIYWITAQTLFIMYKRRVERLRSHRRNNT